MPMSLTSSLGPPAWAWALLAPGTRITTPHSQLRQLILGLPVARSLTKRPLLAFGFSSVTLLKFVAGLAVSHHALSDRFALPIYAQPGDD